MQFNCFYQRGFQWKKPIGKRRYELPFISGIFLNTESDKMLFTIYHGHKKFYPLHNEYACKAKIQHLRIHIDRSKKISHNCGKAAGEQLKRLQKAFPTVQLFRFKRGSNSFIGRIFMSK